MFWDGIGLVWGAKWVVSLVWGGKVAVWGVSTDPSGTRVLAP